MPGVVATDLKEAIVATLQDVGLEDIGENVVSLWAEAKANVSFPAVLVLPGDEPENLDGGDTVSRETLFTYVVAIADRAGARRHDAEPAVLGWRKECMDAFTGRAARLAFRARVPGVRRLEVSPRAQVEIRGEYELAVSAFLLRVGYCEART